MFKPNSIYVYCMRDDLVEPCDHGCPKYVMVIYEKIDPTYNLELAVRNTHREGLIRKATLLGFTEVDDTDFVNRFQGF